MALCRAADVTLVGIGQIDQNAPLVVDGFLNDDDLRAIIEQGAVGEITSWIYDRNGVLIDCDYNTRVASAPLPLATDRPAIAVATGKAKVEAILAAMRGRLVNGLITNEATASRLIAAS
jgi:DNA-binding transcriptional regulator LsrR (DeoR family)